MKGKWKYVFGVLLIFGLCAGCRKKSDDPPPVVPVKLTVRIDFSPVARQAGTKPVMSLADGCDVRYTVDVFAESGEQQGSRVLRKIVTEQRAPQGDYSLPVELSLAPEKYRVRVWVDYVSKGTRTDLHYNTDNLRRILLTEPYSGGTDTRDAFAGAADMDLTSYRDRSDVSVEVPMAMERPCGKFKIVTTDLAKYASQVAVRSGSAPSRADIKPAKVRIMFPDYLPCGYDVETRLATPDDFRAGIGYTGSVTEIDGSKATLGFDYLFIASDQTEMSVRADMVIYDAAGKVINTVTGIRIPIRRNRLSVISGEFLTKTYEGGDVGIDDRFEEEIVVPVGN